MTATTPALIATPVRQQLLVLYLGRSALDSEVVGWALSDPAVELGTVEPEESARSEGLLLTGQGRLLQQLTNRVLESALEVEITDHLGHEKQDATGRGSGNSRNGGRAKTTLNDIGPVEVRVPRDTSGWCVPGVCGGVRCGGCAGRCGFR